MLTLKVGSDNVIYIPEMEVFSTGNATTAATVTMTLYKQRAADGNMTASDATLTSASSPFVAGDASKYVVVRGAGTDGSDHRTTIASYTGAGSVELTDNAVIAVTGAIVEVSLANAGNLSASYVSTGDNAGYQCVLPSTIPLVNLASYVLGLEAADGSANSYRRIPCQAKDHDEQEA